MRPKLIIAYLPSEVVAEILSRLPVKYVIRFKSVCKTWSNIIADSQFVSMHLTGAGRSKTPYPAASLLFVPNDHHAVYLVEPKNQCYPNSRSFKTTEIKIPGSMTGSRCDSCYADGLLCLTSTDSDSNDHIYTQICNPATGTLVELPVVTLPAKLIKDGSLFISAFSFSASTQEYKVVHTIQTYMLQLEEVDQGHNFVFSFGRNESQVSVPAFNSWRMITTNPNVNVEYSGVAIVNNTCHWLIKSAEYILTFDLASETYGSLALPPVTTDLTEKLDADRLSIRNLNGCPSIAEEYEYESDDPCFSNPELKLWILKDYNVKESWTKLIISVPSCLDLPISPISFLSEGELLVQSVTRTLASYKTDDGVYTDLTIEGLPYGTGARPYIYQIHPYIGNLLHLKDSLTDFEELPIKSRAERTKE